MKHSILKQGLAALLTALMLLAITGAAPAPERLEAPQVGPVSSEKTVRVKDVDELVAAIGPNTAVELQPGEYALAAASTYGQATGNQYCRWEAASEGGYELIISGVNGLTLLGAGTDETTILAQDRYANVLRFVGCGQLTVSRFTAGHDPAPGYCFGGVLRLEHCNGVAVEGCALFGCGVVGVDAVDCSDVAVTASRIYECSDIAVSAESCRNVTVRDCEIDHNGWKNEYFASCLFQSYGGDGFTVDNCRIHDNFAGLLLQCSTTHAASFTANQVNYNKLQNAFAMFVFPATVDGCSFHGNDVLSLYPADLDEPSLSVLDGEGKVSDGALESALEVRTLQGGELETPPLREPTEVAPGGEIVVTTVDEFLAAIGPDRIVVLDGESFCLADAAGYGREDGQYYRWDKVYDGYQLTIVGASGMTIRAAEGRGAVTLTAVPRYADVLSYQGCDAVRVSGLTLGHTEAPSECSGAVLNYEGCTGVLVDGCRLYGCGTMGVYAYNCTDVALADCEIYECSIGGVTLYAVYSASFGNCRIHDVPSPALALYDCYEVTWNEAPVTGNHYDVNEAGELVPVVVVPLG